jgi:hypothetical protein
MCPITFNSEIMQHRAAVLQQASKEKYASDCNRFVPLSTAREMRAWPKVK